MHRQSAHCHDVLIGYAVVAATSAGGIGASRAGPRARTGPKDGTGSRFARAVINARAERRKFFDSELFADPAWDMLLELYALECEGRRISVSKLSLAAGVPCTTTLRWLDKLESESLVVRAADPLDGRRMWVGLSDRGFERMSAYTDGVMAAGLPI